ncbi:hypothetical protein IEQ34_004743 [Dendrobium chrysotoxum]|uniref:Uncharacterized protein n=1 Tax=Dendrobium chrysotoxum TaxID=161865 RepID=A0AAV7H0A7_DENCH|nr:hypothetical protein IEQ34_004743 [Dendrobium chrysotoxum]
MHANPANAIQTLPSYARWTLTARHPGPYASSIPNPSPCDPSSRALDRSIVLDLTGLFRSESPSASRLKSGRLLVFSSSNLPARETGTPSTPVHPDSQEEIECSRTQQTPHQSFCSEAPALEEGVWLIDEQGNPIRRRGRTTCADIQNMPPGTRIHIEVNENNIPCNIPESILLGTYLGVVARDLVLAPIAFPDWINKGMEPFKKKMLDEVESKFEFPGHIRHWILQSLGVKWRNYKTTLKAEHWDSRPIEEIMENVPDGVDQMQWCQLLHNGQSLRIK